MEEGVSASLSRGSTELEMSRRMRPNCCCFCSLSVDEVIPAAAASGTNAAAAGMAAVDGGLLIVKNVFQIVVFEGC